MGKGQRTPCVIVVDGFLFGQTGRSGIARSSRSCTFPFLRTFSTSLHSGCEKFTFPIIHCTGSLLSRPPPSYTLCSLFNDWCQEIPPCRFYFHFSKHQRCPPQPPGGLKRKTQVEWTFPLVCHRLAHFWICLRLPPAENFLRAVVFHSPWSLFAY